MLNAKNNILVNIRNESPYIACSIFDEVTSNLTSDYNDLYYEPSTNSCLVRIGVTTKYNTLASWQATGKDLNSITEMPHFAAPDLHINSSIATNIDSKCNTNCWNNYRHRWKFEKYYQTRYWCR